MHGPMNVKFTTKHGSLCTHRNRNSCSFVAGDLKKHNIHTHTHTHTHTHNDLFITFQVTIPVPQP